MFDNSDLIVKQITQILEKHDLEFELAPDKNVIYLPMNRCGYFTDLECYIHVKHNSYRLSVHLGISTKDGDEDLRRRMSEFICRLNWKLYYGCFDYNYDSGTLQYRLFAHVADAKALAATVFDNIGLATACLKNYSAGFMRVFYGGVDAKKAIDECDSFTDTIFFSEIMELLPDRVDNAAEPESADAEGNDESTAEASDDDDLSFDEFCRLFDLNFGDIELDEDSDDDSEEEGAPEGAQDDSFLPEDDMFDDSDQ